jgi:arylformamidase
MSEIIDISLPITAEMPVYPNTAATTITPIRSGSGSSAMSEIFMTSHAGTHIDAPSHAIAEGQPVESIPLDAFYGDCRVLDLTACEEAIDQEDLEGQNIQQGERVLFKTANSVRGFDTFNPDYIYLAPRAAEFLGAIGVSLVGIDCLSVKKKGEADNTSHIALLSKSIPILEGIDLSGVDAGSYTLSAFPLAFRGIDGAPARAVLITK